MKNTYKKNKFSCSSFIAFSAIIYLCLIYSSSALFADSILKKLYFTKSGSLMRKLITKSWFSKATGWYCDTWVSRIHINSFVKKHNINLDETCKPLRKYRCFNDFFTRKLKPEARPIDQDPSSIIAPADGLVYIKSITDQQTDFFVKGKLFNLKTFLQNESLAKDFKKGYLMIFYLSPGDYHRFHFPFDTQATKAVQIKGNYESVNPLVYQSQIQPLLENERHLILLQAKNNKRVAFIPVGALCVGRILETYIPEKNYAKGDEAGYFSFGGSTLVLLFPEKTINIESNLSIENFIPIKMGMKIGSFLVN